MGEAAGKQWISGLRAAELLGIDAKRVGKVLAAGRVRRRLLPGMAFVQYHRADVIALAARSILPPAPEPTDATPR